MIITRTPVRISFFGGGTDYPAYFRHHGGQTLATTIDKYVYVTVHHLSEHFDHTVQVHYSRVETAKSLDEIQIANVREALRLLGLTGAVEIHLVSDLPARTGLGSSSASTVGLLKALHGHCGRIISSGELARQAIKVEQEMVGERVGCQDQYLSAYGGFLNLEFRPEGEVRVQPLPLGNDRLEELNRSLLMFYTGLQRTAHEILSDQVQRTQDGLLDRQLAAMREQVSKAVDILTSGCSLHRFGELLHEGWELKRSLSPKITTDSVDQIYDCARKAGAIGGKLLGAGGGGFVLLFAEPERQPQIREALASVKEVKFNFEPQGSDVIYYHPGHAGHASHFPDRPVASQNGNPQIS
jgi:D-glycero-alpha-D-manno-heptose-7-phosphate kinase